jgi:toxin ParE1/3/4
MKYDVQITKSAIEDLYQIYQYVADNDSVANADNLYEKLEARCFSLEKFPDRGNLLKEFQFLSITQFREIHVKPYRIIYEKIDRAVHIHCILDGRRNLQESLLERLIRA